MKTLIARHLKLYLKKPSNIVLSFLSSLVILSLYFLFIRDFTIQAVSDYGFISNYNELFVDRLMTSGLLIVIGTTSMLSIVFIFMKDKNNNIIKDFMITKVSKLKIYYSYVFASFIISMVITTLIYIGIETYFITTTQITFSYQRILYSILTIFLSNMISSLLVVIVAILLKSQTSFSTFETLYGVVIGFFTGVYIPIGYYPDLIRNIFFYFPLCQTTSILRNMETKTVVTEILKNYPKEGHHILYETFGIHLTFKGEIISIPDQLKMLLVCFLLLNVIIIFFIKKTD